MKKIEKINYVLYKRVPFSFGNHGSINTNEVIDTLANVVSSNPLLNYNPINLKDLNLKAGMKLLTFSIANGIPQIAYHELREIKYHMGSTLIFFKESMSCASKKEGYFKPDFNPLNKFGHSELFKNINYFAIIENSSKGFIPFGQEGDELTYMNFFAYLTDIPIEDVWEIFNTLDNSQIVNKEIKINKEIAVAC